MASDQRRLPVYVLLDCSESMAGDPFAAVKDGLDSLIADLRGDPMALETAYVSVITFASTARQALPLTEVMRLTPPRLQMGSGTAMGAALSLLERCLDTEVTRAGPGRKGDYKPICFLLTDGEPTDDWEGPADSIRNNVVGKRGNVIAVALGPDADPAKLRRVAETVLVMPRLAPGAFKQFFKWVSASVSTVSQRIGGPEELGLALPHLPEGVEMAAPANAPLAAPPPARLPDRHVFLHSRCVKSGAFYLIRYARADGEASPSQYHGAGSFLVTDFELDAPGTAAAAGKPQVSNSQLVGTPPCASCGDPLWAKCVNGHVHCCPQYEGSVVLTCPWCRKTDTYSARTFDVGRGRG